MTPNQMLGLYWETIGRSSTFGRQPGYQATAGPTALEQIYLGVLELVREAKPVQLRSRGSLSLTSSTGAGPYDLASDFLDWWDVEEPIRIGGVPLTQVQRGETEEFSAGVTLSGSQSPAYWYEMGVKTTSSYTRQVGFYPAPSTSYTAYYHYMRKPLAFATPGLSTEYPDLPPDFHEAPVYYAVWKFWLRDPEAPQKTTDNFMNLWQQAKSRFKIHVNEKLRPTFRHRVPDLLSPAIDLWEV